MARISSKEQALTPIYFQTRRETKWQVPPIPLPPKDEFNEVNEGIELYEYFQKGSE